MNVPVVEENYLIKAAVIIAVNAKSNEPKIMATICIVCRGIPGTFSIGKEKNHIIKNMFRFSKNNCIS